MFRDTRKVIQSFQLLVSHQMRPFSSHCPLWVELYLFYRYSGIGEIWGNWTQILKITCRDTWKVIQSLQLFISHQVRLYSSVKALCGSSYTCFPGTWVLEQFWETGPEYSKLCTRTQKKYSKVFSSSFIIREVFLLCQGYLMVQLYQS